MSVATLDIASVRARFSSLQRELVLLDGPGGTQVPDEVIDAISEYLRTSNANVGGPFETSERTVALVAEARAAAGRFLGCSPDEVTFGANMTSLAFALSRTAARAFEPGDEIVVTRLDHDGNVAPWLELADDLGLTVRFADITDDCDVDLADLERQLSSRTRVVAFPVASNAAGTLTDVARIVELAHGAGALAWADAVHAAPHVPTDVRAWDVDVLLCSPYKFFGPHLGIAYVRREVSEGWRPYKVRPQANEPLGHRFETGTQPFELLAGFVAAVEYLESIGFEAIQAHERSLGERFLAGLPGTVTLYGRPTMDGRVPTFMFTVEGVSPNEVGQRFGEQGIAVWPGNYYALEVLRRLGLEDAGGAVRVGFVHYNTHDEVDRVLAALSTLE
ncbi:MAG TPA: cysteine desulfurase-like protein [Gaiellaceae bacterium]|nr:cysteine desulfurase-like protein [Gaiellaceae bacterium]